MKVHLSASPHVRGIKSTGSIMWDVCLALLPTMAFGVYRFGMYALMVLLVSVGFAVLSEYMYQCLTKQKVLVSDGSAVLTGLLLGLNMPPEVPLWIPALGSMFAIVFVKQFFGGLGQNFMNPALGGRCFLLISFAGIMSDFKVDGVSGATPLTQMAGGEKVDLAAMLTGFTGGTIGEVSVIALLIGGIYLLVKKIISWEIPLCYLGSFAVFVFFFGQQNFDLTYVLVHLCGGGIMLGAWFMATDYVTSPITRKGKILYGILMGILTGIFRSFGLFPEGVSYAIIAGNLFVPLLEKITMPKAFGLEQGKKEIIPGKKKLREEVLHSAETTGFRGKVEKELLTCLLILGMCLTLAQTTSVINALAIGGSTMLVWILSNGLFAFMENMIPEKVKIPGYIIILASLAILEAFLMKAYVPTLSKSLEFYIPLIVVNCMLLGAAGHSSTKGRSLSAVYQGIKLGVVFTVALCLVGFFCEVIGKGTVLGYAVMPNTYETIAIFTKSSGAFIVSGTLLAVFTGIRQHTEQSSLVSPLRGMPILLFTIALIAIAISGFASLV